MDKTNHIGILLNSTRFTKITQLWTFTLLTLTVFHTTIQL